MTEEEIMRQRSILAACSVLALASGLLLPTAALAQQPEQDTESSRLEDVTLRVNNQNWLDMHVYVVSSGAPARSLGMVTAHTTREFKLPSAVTQAGTDLRVVADPIGSNELYVSDPVLADPESEVVVTLQGALALSSTSVGPRNAGG